VKIYVFAIVFALAVAATGSMNAQESTPKASLHVWNDTFASTSGAVVYPQYGWQLKVPTGTFSGYGLGSAVPHQEFFTNHLVIYTPQVAPWFSVHTETGGNPNAGAHFFQIGPRINVTSAIPKLKKPLDHLFITALPRFEGVRPNNLLVAGGTNNFKVTKTVSVSIEGYRRFFPRGGYYGEYWVLAHPQSTPHLSWGMFTANDSNQKVVVGFGGRLAF
jgi:hypothetical protein